MATIHWKKAVSGNFNTATNWDTGTVPTAVDDAFLDVAGTYTVSSAVANTVASINVDKTVALVITANTFEAGTAINAGTMSVGNGATLALDTGADNVGTISVNGTTKTTTLRITGDDAFFGAGKVSLSNSSKNQIAADANPETLDNADNTISGAGSIGDGIDNHLTFVNAEAGSVVATGSAPLVIQTGNPVISDGVLKDTGKGGLKLDDDVQDGPDGTIEAVGVGAHVDLGTMTLTGDGVLETSGGGATDVPSGSTATLSGNPTLAGVLNVASNADLELDDALVFDDGGTISLNAGTMPSELLVEDVGTLAGDGVVALGDNSKNEIVSASGTPTLQIGAGILVKGAGTIGDGSLAIINLGTIDATGINPLIITTNGVAENEGLIEATGKGGLQINDDIVDQGQIVAKGSGTLTISNSTVSEISQGEIVVDPGAHLQLNGALVETLVQIVSGGLLDTKSNTSSSFKDKTVINHGTMTDSDGSLLGLIDTAVVNTGTLKIAGAAHVTRLVIDGNVTLTGGGLITLTDSPDNSIISFANGILDNVDNTIAGAGAIGLDAPGTTALENSGVIDASGKLNPLIIDDTAAGGTDLDVNTGLIELTGAGGLTIYSNINSSFGSIVADNATGKLTFNGATIDGGTIKTAVAGATIVLSGATLDSDVLSTVAGSTMSTEGTTLNTLEFTQSAVNAGSIVVGNGSALLLGDFENSNFPIVNSGSITLAAGPQTTLLEAPDGLSLSLAGRRKVTISANGQLIGSGTGQNALLTVSVSGTATQSGTLSLEFDLDGSTVTVGTVVFNNESSSVVAARLASAINDDTALALNNLRASVSGSDLTFIKPGIAGNSTSVSVATNTTGGIAIGSGSLSGGSGTPAAFINVDNTISLSAQGDIGQDTPDLSIVNQNSGTISGGTIAGGSNTIVNYGTMQTAAGGMTIVGTLLNFGRLIAGAGHGQLAILGDVIGTGSGTIMGNGSIRLSGPDPSEPTEDTLNVSFAAGSTGSLVLDESQSFDGTISGFGANTTQAIILGDISFNALTTTATFTQDGASGTLEVTDGSNTVDLTLFGTYKTADFHLSSVNGGASTEITDPPVAGGQAGRPGQTVTIGKTTGAPLLDTLSALVGEAARFHAADSIGRASFAPAGNATLGDSLDGSNPVEVPNLTDIHSADMALLRNYVASSFVTASNGGSASPERTLQNAVQPNLLAPPHG